MNSNPAAGALMILTFLFIMPTLKNSHQWKYSDDNALLSTLISKGAPYLSKHIYYTFSFVYATET